jgi:hypothetical protein
MSPCAAHDPQQVTKVFEFAQPTHSFSPFSSLCSGFEAVDGFGVGTALQAGFRPGASRAASMGLTNPPTLEGWCSTLYERAFRAGLAPRAGYPSTKGNDVLFKK